MLSVFSTTFAARIRRSAWPVLADGGNAAKRRMTASSDRGGSGTLPPNAAVFGATRSFKVAPQMRATDCFTAKELDYDGRRLNRLNREVAEGSERLQGT
jgi:hypothetical protein